MKNYWTPSLRRLLLCAMLMLAGALSQAQAQAQAVSIGIVDEDRLASGYTRYREALVSLDKQAQEMDTRLQARELLDPVAAARFDALVLKETRSQADETELSNLEKKGNGLRAELMGLNGKVDRSQADIKRLEELNGASQLSAGAVQALSDKLFESYKARQTKIDNENTDRANKVIQQVAADKKLSLVWRKRAVIWNAPALDITDAVLTQLNK